MSGNARKYEFGKKTRERIVERDQGACIFCRMGYEMEGAMWADPPG